MYRPIRRPPCNDPMQPEYFYGTEDEEAEREEAAERDIRRAEARADRDE